MDTHLSGVSLEDGRSALQYVQSLPRGVRRIATEAILECSRLGYLLNNLEITSKAREIVRVRKGDRMLKL